MVSTWVRLRATLLVAAMLLTSCGSVPDDLAASGRVDVDTVTVQIPTLPAPAPTIARVTVTNVREGDRVAAGQTLLTLDGAALEAAVRQAEADAAAVSAQLAVVDHAIATAHDKRDELTTKRADLVKTINDLVTKRATLEQTISDLTTKRDQVAATIAQLEQQRPTVVSAIADLKSKQSTARAAVAQLTNQRKTLVDALALLPADDPRIAAGQAQLAQLDQGLATANDGLAQLKTALTTATTGLTQLDAGLTQARAGQAQLDAGLSQATKGLAQLDQGLTQARDGLRQLDDGLTQIDDKLRDLDHVRTLATLADESRLVPVNRTKEALQRATVTAPTAGIVVRIATAGDVLAPGATAVEIRPDHTATATTYLSPEAADRTCVGATAHVTGDWGTTYDATVSRVGVASDYPPTALATNEVHLTRAVPITLSVSGAPPQGAPVMIRIDPCQNRK